MTFVYAAASTVPPCMRTSPPRGLAVETVTGGMGIKAER